MGMRWWAILALVAVACSHPSSTSEENQSLCRGTPHALSVALPNGWPGIDAEAYGSALESSCENLTLIEALPWFDRSGECDARHPDLCTESFPEVRRAFLRSMSAHGIRTVVTSENMNAYGPRQKSDEWFRSLIRSIREDAEVVGLDNVILGAPSEPWASPAIAERRARIAREEWPGLFIVPDRGANHATGMPYYPGFSYDYLEVHPCTVQDALRSIRMGVPILTVTDCGPVLNPGPVVSAELARSAKDLGSPLIIYDFRATEPDYATIHAIGGD